VNFLYAIVDRLFLALDTRIIRRHQNVKRIPGAANRRGGKSSLVEWSQVIGIFQTLIGLNVPRCKKTSKFLILDAELDC
jgi:hypothetical protein